MNQKPSIRIYIISILSVALGLLPACKEKQPQMVLTYSPPEAIVTVDGFQPDAISSPHTFSFYKPGTYQLDVRAQGYMPATMMVKVDTKKVLEQTVHLVKQEKVDDTPNVIATAPDTAAATPPAPADDAPAAAPETEFTLHVTTTPAGATVLARSQGNASEVTFLSPGQYRLARHRPWNLTITHNGYKPARRTVIGPPDNSDVNLNVVMEPAEASGAPLFEDNAPGAPLVQIPSSQPVEPPVGWLTIYSSPPADVSVDGNPIGRTPIYGYRAAPGARRILMENRELAKRKVVTIHVRDGEHLQMHHDL